jgi:hypothetical protein
MAIGMLQVSVFEEERDCASYVTTSPMVNLNAMVPVLFYLLQFLLIVGV